MDLKTTGQFISLLRKEKDMTQKQLAEKLNVSDKAISRWETGRGYPDVESLQALSSEFNVSINELLCGKRIATPLMAKKAEKDIAVAYVNANIKRRHIRNIAICLVVIFILLNFLSLSVFGAIYKEVMGTPYCVIAHDYSYLTLFEERYVPLELDNVECVLSKRLIKEAQVEGAPFIGKLFFGETIYSVKQSKNNDIVYLQTEYDYVTSNYYCRESEVEEYKKILQESSYNQLTAEILTKDWDEYDLKLNDVLAQIIIESDYKISSQVNCDWSRGEGDESIGVFSSQTDGPFRRKEGELLRKQGEYYWFDYDDIPETQNNGDYSGIKAYYIDDCYDEELDLLFSYMFK